MASDPKSILTLCLVDFCVSEPSMERRPRRRRAVTELGALDAVAPSLLGNLHLAVGCPKQIIDVNLRLEHHGSYADAQRPIGSAWFKTRFGNGMPDTFCDLLGGLSGSARQKNAEFITADSTNQVATSHRCADYSRSDAERLIPGAMPNALVEPPQMVDVNHQDRALLSPGP
jgi:hypothetical protein